MPNLLDRARRWRSRKRAVLQAKLPVVHAAAADAQSSKTVAEEVSSSRARADFKLKLGRLLSQAEPTDFACGCCGYRNVLSNTEAIDAICMFSQLNLRRFLCGKCRAIFGPIPLVACSAAQLAELYGCLYRFFSEGFSEPFQEKTFYLMNPSIKGKYLNYACGDWTCGVERLRSLGWDICGFEPFQPVTSPAIYTSRTALAGMAYHGLMTHNYIEHVQDPTAFFRECSSLILPGGKMVHSSPCFDYLFEMSPFHLYFYPGEAVQLLAERTGFDVISEHRADQDYPGYQYICQVLQKQA